MWPMIMNDYAIQQWSCLASMTVKDSTSYQQDQDGLNMINPNQLDQPISKTAHTDHTLESWSQYVQVFNRPTRILNLHQTRSNKSNMIGITSLMHVIKLDHLQSFLWKFCDVSVTRNRHRPTLSHGWPWAVVSMQKDTELWTRKERILCDKITSRQMMSLLWWAYD